MNGPNDDGPANHARDRIHGGGEPMQLAFAPGPADWRRWLLVGAERIVAAEETRVNNPPTPESGPEAGG